MILYPAVALFVLNPHVNFSLENCFFTGVLGLEALLVSTESLYKLYYGTPCIIEYAEIDQQIH
jgi:hypothetical protein